MTDLILSATGIDRYKGADAAITDPTKHTVIAEMIMIDIKIESFIFLMYQLHLSNESYN